MRHPQLSEEMTTPPKYRAPNTPTWSAERRLKSVRQPYGQERYARQMRQVSEGQMFFPEKRRDGKGDKSAMKSCAIAFLPSALAIIGSTELLSPKKMS